MKYVVLLITLVFTTNALSQDLKTIIQEKIWKLNEVYVDNDSELDTLYLYFRYNNYIISGASPEEVVPPVAFSQGETTFSVVPNESTYSISEQTITINDSEESYAFEVIYFDDDDLIMRREDSLVFDDDDGDVVFPYTIEMRFILDDSF